MKTFIGKCHIKNNKILNFSGKCSPCTILKNREQLNINHFYMGLQLTLLSSEPRVVGSPMPNLSRSTLSWGQVDYDYRSRGINSICCDLYNLASSYSLPVKQK